MVAMYLYAGRLSVGSASSFTWDELWCLVGSALFLSSRVSSDELREAVGSVYLCVHVSVYAVAIECVSKWQLSAWAVDSGTC